MNINFKINNDINLHKEEKIITEIEFKVTNRGPITFCGFNFFALLMWFIYSVVKIEFFFWFSIIFSLSMIIIGIFGWDDILRKEQSKYYFTSERIIQIFGKGLFKHKKKQVTMNFEDIAFFDYWKDDWENGLVIIQKTPSGAKFYSGNEKEYLKIPRSIKKFSLTKESKEQPNKIKEIMDLLVQKCRAVKHPFLDNIYITK